MTKSKTIKKGLLGKKELRLVSTPGGFVGMADGVRCTEGDTADDVWRRLHDEVGKSDPNYFGFDGARQRFLKHFKGGFASATFVEKERTYKAAAKQKLDETAPLEAALEGTGFTEAILAVTRATDLLSPFEKPRIQELLRSPRGDEFVQASARFTLEPSKQNLATLDLLAKPFDANKWTIATYLPFFWRPDSHLYLKPEVTKDFATRVGHRFTADYEARLNWPVYESLLSLAEQTEQALADLGPRDRIDIQSFIWVIGAYK
jgi:hypothetical protein